MYDICSLSKEINIKEILVPQATGTYAHLKININVI